MQLAFAIIGSVLLLMLIFFIVRQNRKEKKKLIHRLNSDYPHKRSEEGDIEIDEIKH
jgi:hypothetical protein